MDSRGANGKYHRPLQRRKNRLNGECKSGGKMAAIPSLVGVLVADRGAASGISLGRIAASESPYPASVRQLHAKSLDGFPRLDVNLGWLDGYDFLGSSWIAPGSIIFGFACLRKTRFAPAARWRRSCLRIGMGPPPICRHGAKSGKISRRVTTYEPYSGSSALAVPYSALGDNKCQLLRRSPYE